MNRFGMAIEHETSTSFKRINGPLHEVCQLPEGRKNTFAFEDFNISKSYIEGRLYILVFFCVAKKSDEYFALFSTSQLRFCAERAESR